MQSKSSIKVILVIAAAVSAIIQSSVKAGDIDVNGGTYRFGKCYAEYRNDRLTISNEKVKRVWQVRGGLLYPVSFVDAENGVEWLAKESPLPSALPGFAVSKGDRKISLKASEKRIRSTEEKSLVAELASRGDDVTLVYRFQIFEQSPAIRMQLLTGANGENKVVPLRADSGGDIMDVLVLGDKKLKIIQPILLDQTDKNHDSLVTEKVWAAGEENPTGLKGNIFVFEDTQTGTGILFLKHAPLPHARPEKNENDMLLDSNSNTVCFFGHGMTDANDKGYVWTIIPYSQGRGGRIAALQKYYRQLRRYEPNRDGMFISNTWGDRSRDGRISEPFLLEEIKAGKRLGVDVVQIDDGWQNGRSKNSVSAGGIWEGFWSRDANFWTPDPVRLPNGLKPLVKAAGENGMGIGLWYVLDSSNNVENWKKDAEQVLKLHRELGINYFKIDGINITTHLAEKNVNRFFEKVIDESDGKISIDTDATAQLRQGYFGCPYAGPIFVENRYTDRVTYWPHKTLRNFWQLAQYVDPVRLRMEFLNNSRNQDKYGSDPMAPAKYRPSYLFATVMFSTPLGWFEVSNLPKAYFEEVSPLVKVWKQHRAAVFAGSIISIGQEPNGKSWTGFVSLDQDGKSGYLLMFREDNEQKDYTIEETWPAETGEYKYENLFGKGKVSAEGSRLRVNIPQPNGFIFTRFTK